MSQRRALRVLLLDEDHQFARRLRARLRADGLELESRGSLFELGSVAKLGTYDVILAEPLIGPVNGFEIARYAEAFFPGLPVLLVSMQDLPLELGLWPKSVVGFARKDAEAEELIAEVILSRRSNTAAPQPSGRSWMHYELAKRNRLNGKFNFKLRDWQFELDGLEELPRPRAHDGRQKKLTSMPEPSERQRRPELHEGKGVG